MYHQKDQKSQKYNKIEKSPEKICQVVKTWKQALLATLAPMSISLNHPFRYTFPSLELFLVLILGAQLLSLLRYSCALGFL